LIDIKNIRSFSEVCYRIVHWVWFTDWSWVLVLSATS
jgi:hypothetical protein